MRTSSVSRIASTRFMPREPVNRRLFVLAGALFVFSLAINLRNVPSAPFHPDESRWLNRAHYIRDIADPFGPTWADDYLTRGQPPFGSYLVGLGLVVQGRDLDTNGVWHFHEGMNWNIEHGHMAVADDVIVGRRTNAVVGALTVAVVFLIGARLANVAGGVLGALALTMHPLQRFVTGQVLSDPLLVLLLGLTVLAAIRLAERRTWGSAVLVGVLLGLGGATKLSPLLQAIPFALLGLFLLVRPRRKATVSARLDRALGWRLLALPAIAFAAFVAVSPYLWLDPIGRTRDLFEFRAEEMAIQGEMFPGVAVDGPLEAIARVGETLGERYSVTGTIAGALGVSAGVARSLDLVLAVAGFAVLVWDLARRGLRSAASLVAIVLAGQTTLIVLALRSDFYRYHLPLVFVIVIGIELAGGSVWSLLVTPRRQRLAVRRAVPEPAN